MPAVAQSPAAAAVAQSPAAASGPAAQAVTIARHAATAVLATAITHGAHLYLDDDTGAYEALADRIAAAEGFVPRPYRDSRGVLTVAYGRNLTVPFSRAEGRFLLRYSLDRNARAFVRAWPAFADMPVPVREALLEMAYQLGPKGVLGFHDMLDALAAENWEGAATAALDSTWARETPARAKRIAETIRAL